MRLFILLTTLLLLIFAGTKGKNTPTAIDKASDSLYLAGAHARSLTGNACIQEEDFTWFLSIVQSGMEIPHALIRKHTLIAQPVGEFRGVELIAQGEEMLLLVIRQQDDECRRDYLLTANRREIFDQALVAKACNYKQEQAPKAYTTYRFRTPHELEQLHVEIAEAGEASTPVLWKEFYWDSEGNILSRALR